MSCGEIVDISGSTVQETDREFLGIMSRADVSSTNLIRRCQSDSSLLVVTVKRITSSLVPLGIPPVSVFQSDSVSPIRTEPDDGWSEKQRSSSGVQDGLLQLETCGQ